MPDTYLFGGIIISEKVEGELCEKIKKIKLDYHSDSYFPLKWDFGNLKRWFREHGLEKLHGRLSETSEEWKKKIFAIASACDIKIIISCLLSHSSQRKILKKVSQQLQQFVFSNCLQRLGMYVRYERGETDLAEVILDWPSGGNRETFDDEYYSAYSSGQSAFKDRAMSYMCGELANLNFAGTIFYTGMNMCIPLEVSDLILGATRGFIKGELKGQTDSVCIEMLRYIVNRFRGYPNRIFQYGLIISPKGTFRTEIVSPTNIKFTKEDSPFYHKVTKGFEKLVRMG
jgi:hypothetical protein